MIKPGIKVGPQDWLNRFEQTQATYCEVWYNATQPNRYREVFEYLTAKQIHTGIHFWGTIDDIWEPNVAYPGPTLEKTLNMIKATIDVASQHQFHYVNIHCGNTKLIRIDLNKQIFLPDKNSQKLLPTTAEIIQKQSLIELNSYATSKDIMLLVETIPAKTPTTGGKVTSQHSLPVASLIRRAINDHILITNDFCHTFSDEFDKPLNDLWQSLWKKTLALAPYTKLLHINSVIPPYNGADSHHGITDQDLNIPGAFPTREKLTELLQLFFHRDDVWAIGEPSQHHADNYFALKKLLPPASRQGGPG